MRICKIYDGDYPWDVRVEKIVSSLVQHGHEVHLICRNLARRPTYEYFDKVHIHRLPYFKNDMMNYALSFPAFANPLWLLAIYRIIRRTASDLIIVRDLPLTLAAIIIGRICRVPVVFDMAENYPAMIRDIWKFEKPSLGNIIVRNPFLVHWIEALCVRWVDVILTVVEESRERLITQYHVDDKRVYIVSNTPRLSDIKTRELTDSHSESRGTINLIYIGALHGARNLEVVLKGMALDADNLYCSITIIGTGIGEARLKKLVDRLNIREKAFFEGWVDHNSIGKFLRASDIGIVPHPATEHKNTTVPNKLFDYMAYAKPVLASDTKPVQRIIESEHCGLIFKYDSPEDFRDKLKQLADASTRAKMGGAGKKAIEERFNWRVDSMNLLEAIEKAWKSK